MQAITHQECVDRCAVLQTFKNSCIQTTKNLVSASDRKRNTLLFKCKMLFSNYSTRILEPIPFRTTHFDIPPDLASWLTGGPCSTV